MKLNPVSCGGLTADNVSLLSSIGGQLGSPISSGALSGRVSGAELANNEHPYGCVREVELSGDLLRVTLDPDALHDLGLTDPIIEARLRVPSAQLTRLREVLPRIMAFGRPAARPRLVVS